MMFATLQRQHLLADRSGATALEFALIAPLLFLLLFGAIEAGRLLHVQASLNHAVAGAARCAAIKPRTCSNTAEVAQEIGAGMAALAAPVPTDGIAVRLTSAACGLHISAELTLQPMLLTFGAGPMILEASACARR